MPPPPPSAAAGAAANQLLCWRRPPRGADPHRDASWERGGANRVSDQLPIEVRFGKARTNDQDIPFKWTQNFEHKLACATMFVLFAQTAMKIGGSLRQSAVRLRERCLSAQFRLEAARTQFERRPSQQNHAASRWLCAMRDAPRDFRRSSAAHHRNRAPGRTIGGGCCCLFQNSADYRTLGAGPRLPRSGLHGSAEMLWSPSHIVRAHGDLSFMRV